MILQRQLPYDPTPRALPGIQPLDLADWLLRDEAYAGQMARREALLSESRDKVLAMDASALPAAREVLSMILDHLPPGFDLGRDAVRCPDGRVVALDRADPLATAGRIVQEDICLMEKRGAEHVLTAAILCFPASWTLSEKFLRPMTGIHAPVEAYDADLARRVQRLFDGVRTGRPLWRFNALWYADPELHQPRPEDARRADHGATEGDYLRSERQCVVRLPETRAVAFTIHTYVIARQDVMA